MSKTLFVLELTGPKGRKRQAPPEKAHKDPKKYCRKQKHRQDYKENSRNDSGSFRFCGRRRRDGDSCAAKSENAVPCSGIVVRFGQRRHPASACSPGRFS